MFFLNSAYAREQDVLNCAAVALGVDTFWAIGGLNASSWTKQAMKKAFGAVAKRFLDLIRVGIALVSSGLCIGDFLA